MLTNRLCVKYRRHIHLSKASTKGVGVASIDGGSNFDCRIPGAPYDLVPLILFKTFTVIYAWAWILIQVLTLKFKNS